MTDNIRLNAFPPILPAQPRILLLGTMPGAKSLEKNQYYAHPQNQFWKFMGDIYGAFPHLSYEERVEIVKGHEVAIWDVLQSCTREGSMDADIKNAEVNRFSEFLNAHPTIERIIFDSATAEKYYLKLVLPTLSPPWDNPLIYRRVPSPSPAHARLPYDTKLVMWKDALRLKK